MEEIFFNGFLDHVERPWFIVRRSLKARTPDRL
jgi:hypothetical protein